jgi:hypothetical protein
MADGVGVRHIVRQPNIAEARVPHPFAIGIERVMKIVDVDSLGTALLLIPNRSAPDTPAVAVMAANVTAAMSVLRKRP